MVQHLVIIILPQTFLSYILLHQLNYVQCQCLFSFLAISFFLASSYCYCIIVLLLLLLRAKFLTNKQIIEMEESLSQSSISRNLEAKIVILGEQSEL